MHRGTLTDGEVVLDEPAHAQIDTDRRLQIARAHTSTHVIHQELLDRLGEGATQAGSENAPSRMRFDFRNPNALPEGMVEDVEDDANRRLGLNLSVTDYELPIEEAKKLGAQAIFGEKYGSIVRVVDIGDGWSREFCGGTHVPSLGHVGRIAILGESSVGSGVRRVEALVGDAATGFQAKEHALVNQVSGMLGVTPVELADRVQTMMARLKKAEKDLANMRSQALQAAIPQIAADAKRVGDKLVVAHFAGEVGSADDLRTLALGVRERLGEDLPAVVAVAGISKGKPGIVVATNEGARTAGLRAGDFVREAAKLMGGGGGGRPDIAQGGGQNPKAAPTALEHIVESVSKA